MAELCARISKTPNVNSTKIMGANHQRLLPHRNESSWPAILKRRAAIRRNRISVDSSRRNMNNPGALPSNLWPKVMSVIR